MAGRIKGSVMSFRDSVWDAAGLDASSRDEFTCCREADALFMEKDRYLAMYATRIIQMVVAKQFRKWTRTGRDDADCQHRTWY